MLSEEVRVRLREMGVFPSDEDMHRRKDANPFFEIRASSLDPTKEELDRLAAFVERIRTTRYSPSETLDTFWGRTANTVTLVKRRDGWAYRRMSFTDKSELIPETGGLSVEVLMTSFLRIAA